MTSGYPIGWIREQFPALRTGHVLLDNAAGSQVPRRVAEAAVRALLRSNANIGAAHRASVEITEAKERARSRVAEFVGASDPRQVAFGPNATTMLTLLADGFRRRLRPGDEVIVTELDHHANVDPWRRLAESDVVVRTWPVRMPEAILDVADLAPLVGPRTRVLAVTAASNALGTRPDVAAAAERVHGVGGVVVVDAVHAAAHTVPDVSALGADALVFSPYKVFGPHLGVLYLSPELVDDLPSPALSFMPAGDPVRWETGTQVHESIAGLLGTFDYLDDLAGQLNAPPGRAGWHVVFDAFGTHERVLCGAMLAGLERIGARAYGLPTPDGRTSTVSFNMPGRDARTVAELLAAHKVAVSDGHYYAYRLVMDKLGGPAVRASAVHYNNEEDVERMLDVLQTLPSAS